jgi:hypothetical protein
LSTRCTIWYAEEDAPLDLHLYSECFDDTIWLELRQGASVTTIPLPQAMVSAILKSETCKQFAESGPDTDWAKR